MEFALKQGIIQFSLER